MSQPPPAPPESQIPHKKRPVSQWLILFTVWTVGLLVWTIYIIALLYLFFRFFT